MIKCWYCGNHYDMKDLEVYDNGFNIYRCPYCGERDAIPTHASGFDIDQILRIKNTTRLMLDVLCENERLSTDSLACAGSSAESLCELSWCNQTAQNGFEPTVFIEALKS